jgi:hypothetical protein
MTEGTSAADNARELENAVDTCFTWGEENAVAFDDPKSELMHFTTAHKLDTTKECYVQPPNATRIKPSGTKRWLGLWFNRKLTWKHHIRSKTASAMRVFMALSRLGSTEWELNQTALRQLYQSCITTVTDFGAEVWLNQQKNQSLPLQKLQNQAMRKIAGAFRTMPVAALEAELGIPPADIRLDYKQQSYAARHLTLPDNHPILQLCPDTFPKRLDREREGDAPPNFTPWHAQHSCKPRDQSRLTKILSRVNDIMQPQTAVKTIDHSASSHWKNQEIFEIQIPTGTKTETAKQPKEQHQSTLQEKKHLCLYTDGSLLEG